MDLVIIAAVAENGVIGNKGKIPWFDNDKVRKEDMRRFISLTMGHPFIIGSVTYDEIFKYTEGKLLRGRYHIVVSGRGGFNEREDVIYCNDLFDAIDEARRLDNEIAYIGGGERIYNQAICMPHVRRMEITEVRGNYRGDKFFPFIDRNEWEEVNRNDFANYSFVSYGRK